MFKKLILICLLMFTVTSCDISGESSADNSRSGSSGGGSDSSPSNFYCLIPSQEGGLPLSVCSHSPEITQSYCDEGAQEEGFTGLEFDEGDCPLTDGVNNRILICTISDEKEGFDFTAVYYSSGDTAMDESLMSGVESNYTCERL